jgi:hypothetical protein
MDDGEVRALLTPESLTLLEDTEPPATSDQVVALVTALRKVGHPQERVRAVVNQLVLRKKATAKFGDFAKRLLFTQEGLEQATRLAVASHHAGRFQSAGITSVADCGCGIGGDSFAFAGLGLRVLALEQDAATAALASYNLAPFPLVTVEQADATNQDFSDVEALWIDPARRTNSHRLSNPDDWLPSLTWVFEMATKKPAGIKLAPGMDRNLIPADMEAQWVSHQGDVVELVLWSGVLHREGITRSALVMNFRGSQEISAPADSPDQPVGPLQKYLYEPDGAVIRARLIGAVAREMNGSMLDSSIAYFSSATRHTSPLVQGFRIIETVPYTTKNVESLVARADLGQLEIKKRGIDVDPAELRGTLALTGRGEATLILTRVKGVKTAILAKRIDSVGENVAGADEEGKHQG